MKILYNIIQHHTNKILYNKTIKLIETKLRKLVWFGLVQFFLCVDWTIYNFYVWFNCIFNQETKLNHIVNIPISSHIRIFAICNIEIKDHHWHVVVWSCGLHLKGYYVEKWWISWWRKRIQSTEKWFEVEGAYRFRSYERESGIWRLQKYKLKKTNLSRYLVRSSQVGVYSRVTLEQVKDTFWHKFITHSKVN